MTEAWVVLVAVPAMLATFVIFIAARSGAARWLVDRPNERSLHQVPTPRIGGLGVMAGALPFALYFAGGRYGVALACAAVLCALSAVDDWRSLPVRVRLPAHIVAAIVSVLALGPLATGVAVLLVIAVVWMTNLYNFMDGADGLAGSMAVTGFGAYAIAAGFSGALPLAAMSAAIASAAAGFLAFNAPPARVFLGDAGSVPLGFLAAILGIHGVLEGAWPGWFPVLVFSPFIVDATLTIVRRGARGARVWQAHREHGYQRLVLAGWPPRRLAAAAAALMAAAATSALYALGEGQETQNGIIAGWLGLYCIVVLATERSISTYDKNRTGARQSNGASGEKE
ncbi:hypothetical protein BWI17_05715 [Betaproteobacteria bacterium GR16-43]|nr:hypothetical protein BWI17_05715 [Betaproteobacteria bacterium GR16-43]